MDLLRFPEHPSLAEFEAAAARDSIPQQYGFASWTEFAEHVTTLADPESRISRFERAADAIIAGDESALRALLDADPKLIHERSTRIHRAALIHYTSANGFENYRQKTPPNAVAITKMLIAAGAEVDAVAETYGKGTTLGLTATSVHPAIAGLQIELLETLLAAGASVNGSPGTWNPLVSALHNGRGQAADFLASRGATLDLEGAAGVGDVAAMQRLFPAASQQQKESGLIWACQYGKEQAVDFLLDNGVAVTVRSQHSSTPLHQAAYGGHPGIVAKLIARGAPLEARDSSWNNTPLGWALHGRQHPPPEKQVAEMAGYDAVVRLLTEAGAFMP